MAVLATTHPTLLDQAKRTDSGGKIAKVVELLNLTNELLDDAVWIEGNLPTGHKTTIRTGIPSATWRRLNYGVVPNKSTTAQVTDTCGMLEAYAEVDKALADLNGNTAEFRMSEDRPHLEGMNQELVSTFLYGNDLIDEAKFTGVMARYNSLSAQSGDNIIFPAAGVDNADNASILLICWGPETAHMIFPKGSTAGLQVTDKGQVTLESAPGGPTGGRMEAYRTHYKLDAGFVVRDWRYIVRGQYNQEDLTLDAATGPNLIDLMTVMIEQLPSIMLGRPVFYMNRRAKSFLRRQMVAMVKQSTLQMTDVAGRKVMSFDDIPVRRLDALLATETAIT